MKKIILSVAVATMALSTSVMAIDNVKANGLAKFIYQGSENNLAGSTDGKLLNQAGSAGGAAITLGLTADLSKNLSAGVEVQGLSMLGLDSNLMNGNISNRAIAAGGNNQANNAQGTDDQFWISQAYLSYKMGKTSAKVGIQELNTPFVFTEKWNLGKNTFQAIVLQNNDIENVTLIGAYVGGSNGAYDQGTVNYDGEFDTLSESGVYVIGAKAKFSGVNLQAWAYNENSVSNRYWLEADTKVAGIFLGAQYAGINPEASGADSTTAYAVKVAGKVAGVTLYAAYSSVGDGTGNTRYTNMATGDKTKLYTGTASIFGDGGRAAQEDVVGMKVGIKGKVSSIALGAAYSNYVMDGNNVANAATEDDVIDFFAATKVGPVGVKVIYTNWTKENTSTNTDTKDTNLIRFIASVKF